MNLNKSKNMKIIDKEKFLLFVWKLANNYSFSVQNPN